MASEVAIDDALKSLSRGEQLVRPSLQDASTKRKLSSLLGRLRCGPTLNLARVSKCTQCMRALARGRDVRPTS